MNWSEHVNRWKGCQRCPLGKQRHNICLARSDWPAGTAKPNLYLPCDIVLVGEAPGMSEDTAGLPFVGPAGEHPLYGLNTIIEQAIEGFPTRFTYSITNLVACYPREAKAKKENEPEHGEILECRPRLVEFINLAQPRLIVRVGTLVQRYMNFDNTIPLVDIVHPAHILRPSTPLAKKQMATNKSIVTIRSAIEDVLQLPRLEWKQWGSKHGEEDQTSLRDTYTTYGGFSTDEYGDIPF